MAYRLPNSWRSVLGQQAVTTGRGVTPEQAASMRRGELEAAYNITGEQEDRALRRKQIEDTLALQNAGLEMQGLQFEETMSAREKEFARQMGLNEQQFLEQKEQNRRQNELTQENINKSSRTAETSGYIQAALAIPSMYMAYDRYNDPTRKLNRLEAQDALNKRVPTEQAIGPVSTQAPVYYDYTTDPDFGRYNVNDFGNFGDFDYGYYDYGGYNYSAFYYSGGTGINYEFFNKDCNSCDFGGGLDVVGW